MTHTALWRSLMPLTIHRTLTFSVVAGSSKLEPWLGLSRAAQMGPSEHAQLVLQCGSRLEEWFPLITIQSQELDLDHIKIVRVEQQLVVIPLKKPHGHVKVIRWQPNELSEALEYIRLLRQGQIGAVNVLPFLHDPAGLYMMQGNVLEELHGCQEKEQVQKVLGQCTECMVREWLDIKP